MDDNRKKWYHVDRELIGVKGFYFLTFAAVGSLFPFIPLYMKAFGLSKLQAGIIFGTMPFALFVVQPAMGAIADRFQKHKLCALICCVFTAVCFNLILLVPSSYTKSTAVKTLVTCAKSGTFISDCFVHRNESVQNQICPLNFDKYYRNVKNLLTRKSNTTTSNSIERYNTVPSSFNPLLDEMDLKCSFNCKNIDESQLEHDERLCIGNATNITENYNCFKSFRNLFGQTSFKFRILPSKYKEEQHSDKSSKMCNQFEINVFEYQGAQYRYLYCINNMTMSCEMMCSPIESCITSTTGNLSTSSFWLFFFFLFFGKIGYAPILSLLDAIVYTVLGPGKRYKWGKQRLWGNVSLAVFAVISAVIMDKLKKEHSYSYFQFAFYMYGIIFLVLAVYLFISRTSTEISSESVIRGAVKMLDNGKILVFLIIIFFFGFATGGIEAFLFWYLEAELKNNLKIIPGLCMLSSCIGEIILFYFSGRIIKQIGRLKCLYTALFGFFIRLVSYSFLTNAWCVLPVELLNGVTFSLMWAAATSYGSIIAPRGLSGTMQGVLNGLYSGFGKGIGSLVTGELYTEIGIRWTFRLYGIISLVLLIVYIVFNVMVFEQNVQGGINLVTNGFTTDIEDNAKVKCLQSLDVKDQHCWEESKLDTRR